MIFPMVLLNILGTRSDLQCVGNGEQYREVARAMGVADVDTMSQDEYRQAAIDACRN